MIRKRFGTNTSFSDAVVRIVSAIPQGAIMTYGGVARAAGAHPMAAQSITSILSHAYQGGKRDIPFHRVVYAEGRIWIDTDHKEERLRLYAQEGIQIDARFRIVDFRDRCIDPEYTCVR
jgi:methylated-DNA-protein-cysteine methyltransferase-like protein